MTPKYSIIIRCFNEAEHIGRLLAGIYRQGDLTSTNTEVIVVDSGSTDNTVEIAERYPIRLLHIRKEDFSFGRALNLGCNAACGDFLVIVSAHVFPVYADWLAQLTIPFADPKVALSYGKQSGNTITKYAEHRIFAKWFPNESNFDQQYPFCNNANAAIRRSLWQALPYDESLTGLEDLDWGKRAKQLGYKIAYCANAEIVHVHDETAKRTLNRYKREAIALKHIFPSERFSFWDFMRLLVGNVFSDLYHACCDGVIFREAKEIAVFRLMQFWGTYQGFLHHGQVTSQLRQTFYYPTGLSRLDLRFASDRKSAIDYSELTPPLSNREMPSQAPVSSILKKK